MILKIIVEMSPSELMNAAANGSLEAFLRNHVKDERDVNASAVSPTTPTMPVQQPQAAVSTSPAPVAAPTAPVLPPIQPAGVPPIMAGAPIPGPAGSAPTISQPATPTVAGMPGAPMNLMPQPPTNNPAGGPQAPQGLPGGPASTPAPIPTANTGQYTLDDVIAILAPIAQTKESELQALFAEFGIAQISALPPEHYANLIARAQLL